MRPLGHACQVHDPDGYSKGPRRHNEHIVEAGKAKGDINSLMVGTEGKGCSHGNGLATLKESHWAWLLYSRQIGR